MCFDSGSSKAFINFLNYSFRSSSEVNSLIYAAFDLEYITKEEFQLIEEKIVKIKNLISGFKRYLNSLE